MLFVEDLGEFRRGDWLILHHVAHQLQHCSDLHRGGIALVVAVDLVPHLWANCKVISAIFMVREAR